MIMPVNTPMVSDEYTSLVMSARTSARIGGTMDHRPVAMSSNPSMTFLPQEAEGMTPQALGIGALPPAFW